MRVPATELRQLSAFVALVDESMFTDAAIRLGVTQPAVSRLIAALETRIEVPLVERQASHVECGTSPSCVASSPIPDSPSSGMTRSRHDGFRHHDSRAGVDRFVDLVTAQASTATSSLSV